MPNSILTMDRKALRQHIREQRKSISEIEQQQFALRAAQKALAWLSGFEFQKVALYLTNDGELDTKPLIQALWQLGKTVYVPVLHPFCTGHLVFIEYSPSSPMVQNKYGIFEPKLDVTKLIPVSKLDVIFTPLVAFDYSGNRMGMGGGYYDRTLAHLEPINSPKIVGFAHECQQVEKLPVESWDVPLKQIITPKQIYIYNE